MFTFHDLLANNLRGDRLGHPALVLDDRELSYSELAERAETVAAWLLDCGARRGDRVGIHLRKGFEEVIATFACARIGAVFVNISSQWTMHQLKYIVNDCAIRVLVSDAKWARMAVATDILDVLDRVLVAGTPPDHPKLVAWDTLPRGIKVIDRRPLDLDLAALLYTSGSTGMPKGVMLTHLNLVQGARSVVAYLQNTGADRVLGLLPMSFDYGLNQITTMFMMGGTVLLVGRNAR